MLEILTFLFFAAWRIYWSITERQTYKEKPLTKQHIPLFDKKRISRYFTWITGAVLASQLLFNVQIWPMDSNYSVQVFGFLLVIVGLGAAVRARLDLGNNWANAYEYQVKKKQELVTSGIYKYIRHPIYSGVVTAAIGAELVAQSYLFIVFLTFAWGGYKQAKLEEKLLIEHFGDAYRKYMKYSKMFIPFLW